MKKLIIFIVISSVSLTPSLFLRRVFAQNPGLPSASCQIVLKNNKLIKDAILWKVNTDRIEYEKDGSLHDLLIEEIERIETDKEIITIEQDGKLFKQPYDLIILNTISTLMQRKESDTIYCRITKVTGADIYYYRKKKPEKETHISLFIVEKYIRNGVEKIPDEEKFPEAKTKTDKQNTNYNKSNTVYSEHPKHIGRPPINGIRVAGEIFAGSTLGFAGGAVGGIGGALAGLTAGNNGIVIGAVIGGGIGYILGASGGVYLAGSSRDVKGSYGAAVGGAVLGTFGGVIILAGTQGNIAGVIIASLLPPIGATIAFNSTRKYKSSGTANNIHLGFNQNGLLLTYKF